MKRRRRTPEQILRKLREAAQLLAEDRRWRLQAAGGRRSELSALTGQNGGPKAEDVSGLKELATATRRLEGPLPGDGSRAVAGGELRTQHQAPSRSKIPAHRCSAVEPAGRLLGSGR
jgi:hypothetical protein